MPLRGPSLLFARTKYGDPLPPGDYLAALDIKGLATLGVPRHGHPLNVRSSALRGAKWVVRLTAAISRHAAAGQTTGSSGVVLDGEGGPLVGFLLLAPLVQALLSGR